MKLLWSPITMHLKRYEKFIVSRLINHYYASSAIGYCWAKWQQVRLVVRSEGFAG